ncbi:putative gp37 [Burkholderia pseudomallei ABCPW 107]|nr:putative gp37 [Burkholderia pseudomallei ABCPW 107]KGW80128.1 putative gp37 [Burkholderia pseudomallei MSHR2990]
MNGSRIAAITLKQRRLSARATHLARTLVGISFVRARDGDVLFLESPIRMLPAGVTITSELAIEYRRDEARRRVDNATVR